MQLTIPFQPPYIKVIKLADRKGEIVKALTCMDQSLDMLDMERRLG